MRGNNRSAQLRGVPPNKQRYTAPPWPGRGGAKAPPLHANTTADERYLSRRDEEAPLDPPFTAWGCPPPKDCCGHWVKGGCCCGMTPPPPAPWSPQGAARHWMHSWSVQMLRQSACVPRQAELAGATGPPVRTQGGALEPEVRPACQRQVALTLADQVVFRLQQAGPQG